MNILRKLKGTQDILPADSPKWLFLEETIRRTAAQYAFQEIRTPMFELTQLFARGVGQLTDIVAKEMYTFQDMGGKSLTLKPENTAPVVRAYLENNLGALKPVTKVFYISPMFRQERPQAGRFRQFHQFGVEIIGSAEPFADVESIMFAIDVYAALGLKSFKVKLNSVGDENCRDQYKEILREFLKPKLEKLCGTCQTRFEKNPMRILDCKKPICNEETQDAPKMLDYLDDASASHFESVKALLEENGVAFELDHRLVRGLDYYTRTAYEIISEDLGAQDALCGGGRYDLLAEQLGGKKTPAVGFAAGMERALLVMEKRELFPDLINSIDVFITALSDKARFLAAKLAHELRGLGLSVETDLLGRSLKAQMKEANRSRSRFAVIIGEQELEKGKVAIRDLQKSEQFEIKTEELSEKMQAKLLETADSIGSE